jgi:hypothetical protein
MVAQPEPENPQTTQTKTNKAHLDISIPSRVIYTEARLQDEAADNNIPFAEP